jgi:hypothetical protein
MAGPDEAGLLEVVVEDLVELELLNLVVDAVWMHEQPFASITCGNELRRRWDCSVYRVGPAVLSC